MTKTPEERPSAKAILSLPFIKEELTKYIDNLSITRQSRNNRDRPNTSPSNNTDSSLFRRRIASCKGIFGPIREEERFSSVPSTAENLTLSYEGPNITELENDVEYEAEYETEEDIEDVPEDESDSTWKGAKMDRISSISPNSNSDFVAPIPSPLLTPRKIQQPPQILQMQPPPSGDSPRDKARHSRAKLAPLLCKPITIDEGGKTGDISIKGKGVKSPAPRSSKQNSQKNIDLPIVSISHVRESNIVNATDCYSDDFDTDKEGAESCDEGLNLLVIISKSSYLNVKNY